MVQWLIYLLVVLGVFWPQTSYADIEAVQGAALGPIKTGLEEARAIQEDLNKIQQEIRSTAEGIAGPIKDTVNTVNEVKNDVESNISAAQEKVNAAKNVANDPEGSLTTMGNKMPGFAAKIDSNDSKELNKAVQQNYFMQRPKSTSADSQVDNANGTETTDLAALHQAQEEKMNEIQRENFANLYATAFSVRANLSKEKNEDKDKKNTRDIIQRTKEKSMEMVKRFRKIMLMQTMLFEFNATQQARQFTYAEEGA